MPGVRNKKRAGSEFLTAGGRLIMEEGGRVAR